MNNYIIDYRNKDSLKGLHGRKFLYILNTEFNCHICCICRTIKHIDDFHIRHSRPLKDGRVSYTSQCKQCNKDKAQKLLKEARINQNKYLKERCNHICEKCNKQYPHWVLDFHHIDPSTKDQKMYLSKWTGVKMLQKTIEEANKCMIVCANCHRDIHCNSEILPEYPYA